MVINYFGGGAFRLQSGDTTLLIDPESNRLKADVILRTLTPTNLTVATESGGSQTEISFPGEYEIKGIEIVGVAVGEESGEKFLKTIYSINWEGVRLAVLGHLSRSPSTEIIEKLNEPDVLFLPVGGGHFMSAEAAAKLAKQLEPSFIIPSFYKSPADFLRAIGQKAAAQEKLVFKKKDLMSEASKVVLLEPHG